MEINYYQEEIASQMNLSKSDDELLRKALFEIGIAWNVLTEHRFNMKSDKVAKENIKNVIIAITEYCTTKGWWLEDILND